MSSSGGTGGGGAAAFAFGTAAARPAAAAGNAKTGYYATDTGEITVSDGATWNRISQINSYSGPGTPILAGAVNNTGGTVSLGSAYGSASLMSKGFDVSTVGQGLLVAEGSNAKQGTYGPLVAGTLAVANTSVTASSRIIVCRSPGGTNPGGHSVSAITAGTGFTVTSTNAADTGSGVFQIFEPG